MSDYKAAKEAFVSDITGSSIAHVTAVSSVALASLVLHGTLRARLSPAVARLLATLPAQWALLVLPLLLAMTRFAYRPAMLSAYLLLPAAVARYLLSRPAQPAPPPAPARGAALPALTAYRAHMLLMTALCILAVDFPVFPRALAKCESFGVSLMDLGVGSFVFSQGVVSARTLSGTTPAAEARKILPVALLGFVRLLMVKGTQYPEHVSEYGTHWNFFFTLALLPPLHALLHATLARTPGFIHRNLARAPSSLPALALSLVHQYALSATRLQAFTLDAPRTDLVSANKEGLVSLPGYLAIHFLGVSVGSILLPPRSPTSASGRHDTREDSGTRRQHEGTVRASDGFEALWKNTLLWWALLGLAMHFEVGDGVSRRLANLPYVLWVGAFNVSFLFGYLLLDVAFADAAVPPPPPGLLAAVNRNGLLLFLVANLATGVVNMTMQTMYASDGTAMAVLCVYSFAICAAAWAIRGLTIKLPK